MCVGLLLQNYITVVIKLANYSVVIALLGSL